MDERYKRVFRDPRFKKTRKADRKFKVDERFQSMFTDERFQSNSVVDKRGKAFVVSTKEELNRFYDIGDCKQLAAKEKLQETESHFKDSSKTQSPSEHFSKHADNVRWTKRKKLLSKIEQVRKRAKRVIEVDNVGKKIDSEDRDSNEAVIVTESTENEINSAQGELIKLANECKVDNSPLDIYSGDEDNYVDIQERSRGVYNDDRSNSSSETEPESDSDLDDPHDAVLDADWNELDRDAPDAPDVTSRLAICNINWDRVKAVDLLVLVNSFKPQAAIIKSVSIYKSEFGKERLLEEEVSGPKELLEVDHNSGGSDCDDNARLERTKSDKLRVYQLNRLRYFYAVIDCDSKETANHIYEECDGAEVGMCGSVLDLRFIPADVIFSDPPHDTASVLATSYNPPPQSELSALHHTSAVLTWDETDRRRVAKIASSFEMEQFDDEGLNEYIAASDDSDASDVDHADSVDKYKSLLGLAKDKHRPLSEEVESSEDELDVLENRMQEGGDVVEMTFDDDKKDRVDDGYDSDKKEETGRSRKDKKPTPEDAELALLVADEDDGKAHFSLKKILDSQKELKGKKKRKSRGKEQFKDDFELDKTDPRFEALYSSSLYAVDPSDPRYKETTAMKDIIKEMQLRKSAARDHDWRVNPEQPETPGPAASLSVLMKSVKSKSETFTLNKHMT